MQVHELAQRAVTENAARILVQAQMLMPKKNWVQQQLAIARTWVLINSQRHTKRDQARLLPTL